MVEYNYSILRIIAEIAAIGTGQIAITPTNDSVAGVPVFGYKDASGNSRRCAVLDVAARFTDLTVTGDFVYSGSSSTIQETGMASAVGFSDILDNKNDIVAIENDVAAIEDNIVSIESKISTNVLDYGAVGDGATDDTAAIQAAIDSLPSGGVLVFPEGVFLTDELTVGSANIQFRGSGYFHYSNTKGTILKSRTLAENSILTLSNGSDGVVLSDMKLDADDKANMCIDAFYGAFLTIGNCGFYRSVTYGIFSKQGLARINNCYFGGHAEVGYHCYSDAAISNTEFTGGTIPLLIVAGGNRFSNIWINSGTQHCIKMKPYDATTNHINTSFVNMYIGEVNNTNSSLIYAEDDGTNTRRVRQVQFSNSHIVAASFASQIVDMIKLYNCDDWVISNIAALGYGTFANSSRYVKSFLTATSCNRISVSNTVVNGVTQHNFLFDTCTSVSLGNITLQEAGGAEAVTAQEKSGIAIVSSPKLSIQNLYAYSTDSGFVAIHGDSGTGHQIGYIYYDFPNATRVTYTANEPVYVGNSASGVPVHVGQEIFSKMRLVHGGAANDVSLEFDNGAGIYSFGSYGLGFSDGGSVTMYFDGNTLFMEDGDFRTTGSGKGLIVESPDGITTKRISIDNAGALTITTP